LAFGRRACDRFSQCFSVARPLKLPPKPAQPRRYLADCGVCCCPPRLDSNRQQGKPNVTHSTAQDSTNRPRQLILQVPVNEESLVIGAAQINNLPVVAYSSLPPPQYPMRVFASFTFTPGREASAVLCPPALVCWPCSCASRLQSGHCCMSPSRGLLLCKNHFA
jgi:hypothetical protein